MLDCVGVLPVIDYVERNGGIPSWVNTTCSADEHGSLVTGRGAGEVDCGRGSEEGIHVRADSLQMDVGNDNRGGVIVPELDRLLIIYFIGCMYVNIYVCIYEYICTVWNACMHVCMYLCIE